MTGEIVKQAAPTPLQSRSRVLVAALGFFAVLLFALPGRAEGPFGTPTAPVSRVHGNAQCAQCHLTKEEMPAQKCLACHAEIATRNKQRRGLHATPKALGKQCWKCHLEHRGENADILGWASVGGQAAFDHGLVDFPLTGKHAGQACQECHTSKNSTGRPTFLDNANTCAPCHAKDDAHQGNLGASCLKCHVGDSWKASRFDHSRDSSYPLRGKHLKLAADGSCNNCHPNAPRQFKPRATQCGDASCHGKDDPHKGNLGAQCSRCHSETSEWAKPVFDHNDPTDKTRWRLVGNHLKVPCDSCHRKDPKTNTRIFRGTPTQCEGCHLKDDDHKGDFGTRCGSCHEARNWRVVHTGHDITPQRFGGAHDRVGCVTCHSSARKLRGMGNLCISCHQRDDIHHNSLGPRCGDCHTQQTFAGARFNHDTVGCTLRGIHRVLPCVDCHRGGNYAGVSPMCISCHRDDAMRAAGMGIIPELHVMQTGCTYCHNTVTFRGALTRQSPPESVCQ